MSVWMPGIETRLYRFIAKIAASLVGTLDPVLGVYTRRSVTCDEVVFGKSDIDLHILIKPFPEVRSEALFLRDLTATFRRVKRLLPCVGHCEVSTTAELSYWYESRPYTWYRDRGWLKLYGAEFERPRVPLSDGKRRDSLLWWFFQVWESLPEFYRAGDVRNCCHQFLDMLNAYGLYVGAFDTPKRRADVLRYWQTFNPPAREYEELWRAFHKGFRGNYRALNQWIYRESLKLCDALAPQVIKKLEGEGGSVELQSQVPFGFSRRTYLLVNPLQPEEVRQALFAMQRRPEVCVTTAQTLTLYLYHRNPWEYYTMQGQNRPFSFSSPSSEALQRAVGFCLHREVPRRAMFTLGRKADRSSAIGYQYAQCRLYSDRGTVAADAADLVRQYERCYGTWPYKGSASRDDYFLHDYPVICKTIEDLSRQIS